MTAAPTPVQERPVGQTVHREPVAPTGRRRVRRLLQDRTALIGLVIIAAMAGLVLVGPLVVEHEPTDADVTQALEPPSEEHLLGTDHLGRDVLTRLLYGGRLSIGATVLTAFAIAGVGTAIGLLAGYAGGVIDTLISRAIDVLLAFPGFLLALALVGLFGPSLRNVMLALIAVAWAGYARIVRSAVLVAREEAYIEAARSVGASHVRVMLRHVFPNIRGPVIVLTTLDMGSVLLSLSALSFLGLGVQPPAPEWGAMLTEAKNYLTQSSNMMLFPGLAIFLTVLGFNLLGDGLRDVLDPRTQHTGHMGRK